METIRIETSSLFDLMKATLNTVYQNSPLQEGVKEVGENIYVVLVVTMLVWLGLFAYMMMMNKRVKDVEEQLERLKK